MKGRGIIFAAMLAACACAAPAQGALIHMDGVTPTFTADPGERNDLWVNQSATPPVNVFNDTGPPMRTELPCFAFIQGPERYCPISPVVDAPAIQLGDLDDKLRSSGIVAADGGAGNDDIQILNGRAVGGAGDDHLWEYPPPGYTTIYPLDLDGGPGDDYLAGTYESDTLTGGAGRDSMNGDQGSDVFYAQDGETDTVNCGYGWGTDVAYVDAVDIVSACEEVHLP